MNNQDTTASLEGGVAIRSAYEGSGASPVLFPDKNASFATISNQVGKDGETYVGGFSLQIWRYT